MDQTVSIRLMEEQDLDAIMEVETQCFTLPWSREAFYNELHQNRFAHYLVLEEDGKVIGYCGAWLVVDEAHITNIAVLPAYQGKGFGEVLLSSMIAECKERAIERMTLEVRASNHVAQGLYKKLGFAEGAIRKNYYSDNQEDAIVMWVNIE
ncbi:MAG: ribosomal protein S18-alanine N-acetyltransferase [Bacillus sp. (in: firmicutes)]